MKKYKRPYLIPFTYLYDGLGRIRNFLYDRKILSSTRPEIPMINVGNLQVGGTGKSPMIDYLVQLLEPAYNIAVLSRGYKRKTKGFVLANAQSTVSDIGDEALQLYRKHPGITVAVSEDRRSGIQRLLEMEPPPDVILLDDAMQHRKITAGLNLVLTVYGDLYVDDAVLPAGNLRENIRAAARAQIIVVSKCPPHLTENEQFEIARRLEAGLQQTVFFTSIGYADFIFSKKNKIPLGQLNEYSVLLITGIARPESLLDKLHKLGVRFKHLTYPDHHHFSEKNLRHIEKSFEQINSTKKLILCTEKDYVRIFDRLNNLYYLPVRTEFVSHGEDFNKMIIDYVEKSQRNSGIPEK